MDLGLPDKRVLIAGAPASFVTGVNFVVDGALTARV
jgi:hypothetical protein